MADSIFDILSSSEQIQANYSKYADKFKDSTDELVNSETFLNLLVAEMTNQDPLEPTSNTEFITQMAQFTSLQYMQDSSTYSKANYAASLVGKIATGSKMEGTGLVTKTGVVESVTKNGSDYSVVIDGVTFDLSAISAVTANDTSSSYIATGNELGDQISRASMMVGMYATVNVEKDGGTFIESGFIDAIQVKDGEISAVINGLAYKISDIVEVTYATIATEPDEGAAEDSENVEGTESVEGAAEAENAGEAGNTEQSQDVEDIEETTDISEEEIDAIFREMVDEIIDEISEDDEFDGDLDVEEYPEDLADITEEQL